MSLESGTFSTFVVFEVGFSNREIVSPLCLSGTSWGGLTFWRLPSGLGTSGAGTVWCRLGVERDGGCCRSCVGDTTLMGGAADRPSVCGGQYADDESVCHSAWVTLITNRISVHGSQFFAPFDHYCRGLVRVSCKTSSVLTSFEELPLYRGGSPEASNLLQPKTALLEIGLCRSCILAVRYRCVIGMKLVYRVSATYQQRHMLVLTKAAWLSMCIISLLAGARILKLSRHPRRATMFPAASEHMRCDV